LCTHFGQTCLLLSTLMMAAACWTGPSLLTYHNPEDQLSYHMELKQCWAEGVTWLTLCLSMCSCLRFGSNSSLLGSRLTGDCLLPLLQRLHSGLIRPQNAGPATDHAQMVSLKLLHFNVLQDVPLIFNQYFETHHGDSGSLEVLPIPLPIFVHFILYIYIYILIYKN
jgi:hypothetical protein